MKNCVSSSRGKTASWSIPHPTLTRVLSMTGILKHKYKKHPLKCQETRLTGTNKTAGVHIGLIRRNKTQVRSSFASRVKSEKKLLSLLHSFKLGIKCHIKVFPTFAQRWQGYRANCFSSVIDIISGGSIVQLWLNLQLVSLKKLNWTINSMMLRFHANSGCSYDCTIEITVIH